MKVLKFGGTSVGTADSLRNVRSIVEAIREPAVVVVSALGGLTDRLISTAGSASQGDPEYVGSFEAMAARHHSIITDVVPAEAQAACRGQVDQLLAELRRLYDGVALIADLPQRTLDAIVSLGERMSSIIVAAMLPAASHHDSLRFIKTEKWFGRDIADQALTKSLIAAEFTADTRYPAVTGGFISTDRDSGEITNLGRGGSDFTAALVAAALDAEELEIWTDVDGFMTSDPRIIPTARVIPEMSFVESMELCSFGAKVIYPPTIYPVFHKNIPIRILNTFHPEAPGTFISDGCAGSAEGVRGISALRSTCLMSLHGPVALNIPRTTSRAFNAMARNGIGVFLVSQNSGNPVFSFAVRQTDAEAARSVLNTEFAPELTSGRLQEISIRENLAILAVVGEEIKSHSGIGARVLHTLRRNEVEVAAYSDGASKTTVTFVINEEDVNRSIALTHSLFFPSIGKGENSDGL